jgi:hypothetical protein
MGKKGNYKFVMGLLAGVAAGMYINSTHGQKLQKKVKSTFDSSEGGEKVNLGKEINEVFNVAKNTLLEYFESLVESKKSSESSNPKEDSVDY